MELKKLNLDNEIKSIKEKIEAIGGYHIIRDNGREEYIVQCWHIDFDRFVDKHNIKTEPITILDDYELEQSFKVGNVIYFRD